MHDDARADCLTIILHAIVKLSSKERVNVEIQHMYLSLIVIMFLGQTTAHKLPKHCPIRYLEAKYLYNVLVFLKGLNFYTPPLAPRIYLPMTNPIGTMSVRSKAYHNGVIMNSMSWVIKIPPRVCIF